MGTLPRRAKSRFTRRDFLGLCGFASGLLLPAPLLGTRAAPLAQEAGTQVAPANPVFPDYRIVPNYGAHTPLEELVRKARQKVDDYPSEKYAREIESRFARWAVELRQKKDGLRALAAFLSLQLTAASPSPRGLDPIRKDSILVVQRASFSSELSLGREAFLQAFQSSLALMSDLLVAEFGVAELEVASVSPLRITTQVRYALVGTGARLHRLQRIGVWKIDWEQGPAGELLVTRWQPLSEIQSFSYHPIFVDITSAALKDVSSYRAQLLRGTDYWRTVLDAATGIDIYGNNGIAAGDYDNDGFDDLYICQPSGLPNRLYHNRGDGTFEDVTEAAGVGVLDGTACALFADLDNDGYQDLIVVRSTGPLLFLNQRNGKFELKGGAFRFVQPPQGTFTGAAMADYDRDGRLDIYFCLYSYYQGLDQYHFPLPYYDARNGPPNFLFHNEGDATFRDVTAATGLNQNNDRFSFDCNWCDYDHDGWPDLYVVNDFGRKNLYHNNGNGTFTDAAEQAGVLDVGPGMSSCWFDYDNDLKFDLYVSDMWEASGMRLMSQMRFLERMPADVRSLFRHHAKGNSLYHNLDNGRFEDVSAAAGIEKAGWSWSCYAWDFAHDGRSHLYIANGMISGPRRDDLESFFWQYVVSQSPADAHPTLPYELGWNAINELIRSDGTWAGYRRNVFFFNNGDGTFSDIAGVVGLDFPDDSRAFALADFDHDGRLEIFLKNRAPLQLRILRNEMQPLGKAIAFRLRGTKSNRDAVGAEVTVETEIGRQTKFLQAGTGFLSQHTKELFFGLGDVRDPVRATIRWPSGLVQQFEGLPPEHRIAIEEGGPRFQAIPFILRNRDAAPHLALQQPAPLPPSSETWLTDPIPAPDFALSDLAGTEHALRSFRGHPVLVNFWATWCPACEPELRVFQQKHVEWAARGLRLVSINTNDPGERTSVQKFARERNLSFLILLATEDILGIYNILYRYLFDRRRDLGIPTSFLLDEEGSIVKVYQGPLNPESLREDAVSIPRTAQERIRKALPFPGGYSVEFQRNYFTYGVEYSQRGFLDQAIAWFGLALRFNPMQAEAHYNLGTLYLQKKMPLEAREHLRRALELRPGHADTLNNLGLLAAEAGDEEDAVNYFQEAIRQEPSNIVANQNLATIYRQLGRLREAQEVLERALELDPGDPELNYGLGLLYAQKEDTESAREFLLRALRLRPDYPEALNNLGVLYLNTRRLTEAAAAFQECIRLAPAFDQPYLNLAKLYVLMGDRRKAQGILRQLLERQPNHALAQEKLDQLSR